MSLRGTGGSGSPSGSLPARPGEQLFSSCSPRGHREDQSASAAAPAANKTGRSYGSKRINASGHSGSSLILSHKGTPRNQPGSGRSFPWKPVILRLLLQDGSYLLLNHLPRAGSCKSPGWSLPSSQLSDTGGCSSQQRRVLAPSPPQRHLAPIRVVLSGQRCPRVPQRGTRRQWGWHGGTKPCREGTASPSQCQGASLLSCNGHPGILTCTTGGERGEAGGRQCQHGAPGTNRAGVGRRRPRERAPWLNPCRPSTPGVEGFPQTPAQPPGGIRAPQAQELLKHC